MSLPHLHSSLALHRPQDKDWASFKASTIQLPCPPEPPFPSSGTLILSLAELLLAPRTRWSFLSLPFCTHCSFFWECFHLTNFYSPFKNPGPSFLICSAFATSPRQHPMITPTFQEASPHLTKEAWTHCLWPASWGH